MTTNSLESDTKEEMVNIVKELFAYERTYDESQEIYTKWAKDGSFDHMLQSHQEHYNGPYQIKKNMKKLFPDPENVMVFDLGSGSGIVGQMLLEMGFKNLHGLEPNKELVKISKEKGIYQKVMEQFIGNGAVVDAENDTYDAIVSNGTFCPGQIPCDSLHEIVRVLKPGGYFINCTRVEFLEKVPEYRDNLNPLINKLKEEGKCKSVTWEKYENQFEGKEGITMVFQTS